MTVFVGLSMMSHAKIENLQDSVKKIVIEKQHEFLKRMQSQLHGEKTKKVKINERKMSSNEQFLFETDKIDSLLNIKKQDLKSVFNALCKKGSPAQFIYEETALKNVKYKIEIKAQKEIVDSSTLVVTTMFETHTIAKDNISDVKYKVNFAWEADLNKLKSDKIKLVSSEAELIEFLTSDKRNMRNLAKKFIINWYANLSTNLDKEFLKQAVVPMEPMQIVEKDIHLNLPENRNFVIKDVPEIKIFIDPYQYIDDKQLYTDPVAYMILKPIFDIAIDNTLSKVETVKVSYVVKEIIKPQTDKAKEERRNMASQVVENYLNMLSNYATTRNIEQKTDIKNMFIDFNNEIEVSYLAKNGKEKIKKQTLNKYLNRLKAKNLTSKVIEVLLEDSNMEQLIYVIHQEYRSKTYNDNTHKKIYLNFDVLKNTYVIDKIEVVTGSTKPLN